MIGVHWKPSGTTTSSVPAFTGLMGSKPKGAFWLGPGAAAADCAPTAPAAVVMPATAAAAPPARSTDRRDMATTSPKYSLSVRLGTGLLHASLHFHRQVAALRPPSR